MKTLTFSGMGCCFWLCLDLASASAATVNLGGASCDACINFVLCVAKEVEPDIRSQMNGCTGNQIPKNYETASNKCAAKYSAVADNAPPFAELAWSLVGAWVFDTDCGGIDENITGQNIAYSVLEQCAAYGFCQCGAGYFIQPRGLTSLAWGINSECKQCPTGGTTESYGNNYMLIESCFIPAGDFSDQSGVGVYTDVCRASYSSPEEAEEAWQ